MFTQMISFRRLLAVTTALSMAVPALPAQAQDASTAAPPARVGAIAGITGTVTFNGAGSNNQWVAATPNYPVSAGDSVFTQDSSQATLAVDSSRITLNADTELQMTGLDNNSVAATESQGEVFLAVNYLQPGQSFTITTPRGNVAISQNGNYDIAAGDQTNPTVVTVLAGAATVTDPGATLQVAAGQEGVLSGTDQTVAQLGQAQSDPFITQMLAQNAPPPPSYAPPVVQQMTGVSQLGNYGDWQQSSQYGAVWYPQVSSGWAPYQQGHWAYIAPWGYTWVDNEPWGFAPFHYGRWFQDGGRWGWAPAPAYSDDGGYGPSYQPVYAPAVVSFFGLGVAAGITIGALSSGSVGWVPLGPDEPYYPSYRCPPDYIRRINVVNVRNINIVNIHNTTINNYNYGTMMNRRAATYIPADAMSRGDPVGHYAKPVQPAMFASARPMGPEGFRPAPGGPNGGHNAPLALPPPNVMHHAEAPPHISAFGERHTLPPAVISHEPAPQIRPGQPFAGPRPAVQAVAPQQHPGFANNPGFHPPPAPPGGQHFGPTGAMNGNTLRPGETMAPQAQHPQNEPQHPAGFATMPGYHPPPAPPTGQNGQHFGPSAGLPEARPQSQPQPAFHPQEQQHAPMPQVFHPQEQAPQQAFHAQPQQHAPMPQVFHPQEQAPQQSYHPPVQQQFHPPAPQQFHPPVEQQQFHPQVQQQFHPQEQPRPPEPQHQEPQHEEAPRPNQHP